MNAAADENPWAAALKRKTSSGNEDGERPPRTRARHSWSRTSEKHAGPRVAVGIVQGEGRNGGEEEELPMQTKHRKQADNSSPHSPGAVTRKDCGEGVAGRPEHVGATDVTNQGSTAPVMNSVKLSTAEQRSRERAMLLQELAEIDAEIRSRAIVSK